MTLVVAKKRGDVLSLVSDTGITLKDEQLGPDNQMPKLCILDQNLAVGFSGSPDLALRIIQTAPKNGARSYGNITNHFLQGHRQHEVDFILAFGPPLSKLALVADGRIQQNRTTEWIGDKNAFEAFQEFRHTRKPRLPFIKEMLVTGSDAEARQPTFELIGSMRTVIERSDVPSVFGHAVALSNVDGPFGFRSYLASLEEMQSFRFPPGADPIQVMNQINEAKAYAFSCFVNTPGDASHAIAFHYMRGKITYVYHGRANEPLANFVLHKELNVLELGEWAKNELGVNWIGRISSRTGLPPGYGVPAEQWKVISPRPS